MKISTKHRDWLLKKINPLFLFSASIYLMALLGHIQSDQVHGLIGSIVDFYNIHNIFYICLFIATIYSLVQNTQYVFDLTGKLDWLRILGRYGTEFAIMLFGTLASLFAFLILFATRTDIITEVIIFAITCITLNVFRSRFVNFYDNGLDNLIRDRQKNRQDKT